MLLGSLIYICLFPFTYVLVSIACGETTGDVPMDFIKSERTMYKQTFLPLFGSFLMKCFSKLPFLR